LIGAIGIAHLLLMPPRAAGVPPASCLPYEPAVVRLEGTIRRHTFAGPPGYESVKTGDRSETMWILTLAKPVCVEGVPGDDISVAEASVSRVQLVLDGEQYKKYRHLVGKAVWGEGTLFHQHTGPHYEKVLLMVGRLGPRGTAGTRAVK
jgi:hypothetical protein